MRTFTGLKRGLGYFSARPRQLPEAPSALDPATWTPAALDAWTHQATIAQQGRSEAWALLDAAEALDLAREVREALRRFDHDEKARGKQIGMVLRAAGRTPPPRAEAPAVLGATNEAIVMTGVLGVLIVNRSLRGTLTYAGREETSDRVALALITSVSADAIAHADLGFLIWPLVAKELARTRDAEALNALVQPALSEALHQNLASVGQADSGTTGAAAALRPSSQLTERARTHLVGALARRLERLALPVESALEGL